MHIIDYKTGKNMLDEEKLKGDMQMSIYALALNSQFNKSIYEQRADYRGS